MCLIFLSILNLPHHHIIPDSEEPKGEAATSRPRDCKLDTTETELLFGKPGSLEFSIFEEWWEEYLGKGKNDGEGQSGTSKE